MLTHPHADHIEHVDYVLDKYSPSNIVTSEYTETKAGEELKQKIDAYVGKVEEEGGSVGQYTAVASKIPAGGDSNEVIDPFDCELVDPKITVLFGNMTGLAEASATDKKNVNNHSVVLRVDFEESSFLLTGDLQEGAIKRMMKKHENETMDVDVYKVGHHGSHNATTKDLLEAMTPETAVLTVGPSTRKERFSAWSHGHPRKEIVELLEEHVSGTRDPITVDVATAQKTFAEGEVEKAIYATAWDGTIVLTADKDGRVVYVE